MVAQTRSVLIVCVLFAAGPLSAAEDLAEVEKKLKDAWETHTSMRAKMTIVSDFSMQGMSTKSSGKGTVEYMKKGTQSLSRSEQTLHMVMKMQDQNIERDQKMIAICDGQNTYTLTEADGQVSALRMKGRKSTGTDPASFFEQTRKEMDLKLLPSEKADGKTVYVIEGTAKKKAPVGLGKVRFHFRQDGVMLKFAMLGPDGKPATTVTHSDIELNVKIDPERFVFKAPPGVEVQDMGDVMRGGARRKSPGF